MGRGYTFTCHTCRIVYEVGYGSYGHYCLQPDFYNKETLAEYKRRMELLLEKERGYAIEENYRRVMVLHSLHDYDAIDSEFSEVEEDYDARRAGYFHYDFQDVWHKRWSQAIDVIRKAVKKNPSLSASDLVRIGNEAVDCDVLDEDRANLVIELSKPKPPLPKDLHKKLRNFNRRMRASS